jgi:RNA polymerase sigma-70 factor, ECF subfamily
MLALERLSALFHKHGSTLIRTGFINGLPGFVTKEAHGAIQTTALEIEEDKVVAIYVMRNPDKLRHLH